MNIVPTDKNYNSLLLTQNLIELNHSFPFLNIQTVGTSVLGKNLYVIKLGNGPKKVFYSAAIHANEWITSVLLMKFIEDYCDAYNNNSSLYGYSVRRLFNSTSIYIMPMVNPDGVGLTFIGIVLNFYDCFNNSFHSIFSFSYSLIQFNLLNAK